VSSKEIYIIFKACETSPSILNLSRLDYQVTTANKLCCYMLNCWDKSICLFSNLFHVIICSGFLFRRLLSLVFS